MRYFYITIYILQYKSIKCNKKMQVMQTFFCSFNLPDFTDRVIQGGTVGSYKSAGLPNITGAFGSSSTRNFIWDIHNGCFSGTLSKTTPYYQGRTSYSENSSSWGADFNASLSNPIYGNSSTVQPPALCVNVCIKY